MRNGCRATWFSSQRLPSSVAAYFVLRWPRRVAAPLALLSEVQRHDDMLFVDAPSNMSRDNGPLLSLALWLGCAALIHPEAHYVGKADDDVWLHLPQLESALTSTLSWLHRPWGAYVGMFEGYHWRGDVQAPAVWRHGPVRQACESREAAGETRARADRKQRFNVTGPFSFARGGCFFVSSTPARQLAAQLPNVSRIVAGDRPRCQPGSRAHQRGTSPACERHQLPAWEDVWARRARVQQ